MNEQNIPAPALPSPACAARFGPWLLGALGAMTAVMICFYHGGEQSYVRIHDCLDGNIPMCSAFMQSDACFDGAGAVFQPLLGGIPRNCMPGETCLHLLPYRFLSAFHAFVLCEFLVKAAALAGMALLLRRHLIPNAPPIVVCGAALCFSLLPFYPGAGLTVAGQPLLLYAILNLRNRDFGVHNWLIVGLFPFLSSLVLIGFVLIPLLALFVAYEWFARRSAAVPLLAAWVLLTGGYAIAEYRLIGQVFAATGFVSHRVEFAADRGVSLSNAVKAAILNFIHGEFDADSVQYPVILLACAAALAAWMIGHRRGTVPPTPAAIGAAPAAAPASREVVGLVAAWIFCGMLSLCVGLYDWSATGRLIDAVGIPLLRSVQFQRVNWLHPLCWGLAFAFALALLSRKSRLGLLLALLFIATQAAMAVRTYRDLNDAQSLTARNDPNLRLSFGEFFSAPLFAEIRDYIGRPQNEYRVASLGIYPAIPLYNGFYTADGYANSYPLDYKHRFRKAIAGELAKSPSLRSYFDEWGSRCYLFSSELGKSYLYVRRRPKRRIERLDVDTAALRSLGVEYIFSAVEIGNAEKLGLKLERTFERNDSPWQIYVYACRGAPLRGAGA